jgi:hypothetical protein
MAPASSLINHELSFLIEPLQPFSFENAHANTQRFRFAGLETPSPPLSRAKASAAWNSPV